MEVDTQSKETSQMKDMLEHLDKLVENMVSRLVGHEDSMLLMQE